MRNRPITRHPVHKSGNAVACMGYRAAEQEIVCERTARIFNNPRTDVPYAEIILPDEFQNDPDMAWAKDRYLLGNTMEFAEPQHNGRVGRDLMMILPDGLTRRQGIALGKHIARWYANTYGSAVDVSYHTKNTGRARHNHLHFIATTRRLGRDGLLEKTNAEISGYHRQERGLKTTYREEHAKIRQYCERQLVRAMERAGLSQEEFKLYREYGQGETTAQYHKRLKAEGFDLNKVHRDRYNREKLTPAQERRQHRKQILIKAFEKLQDKHRLHMRRERSYPRRLEADREKREGTFKPKQREFSTNDVYRLKRWDPRRGLLNHREILKQTEYTPRPRPRLLKLARIREEKLARKHDPEFQNERKRGRGRPPRYPARQLADSTGDSDSLMATRSLVMRYRAQTADAAAAHRNHQDRAARPHAAVTDASLEAARTILERHRAQQKKAGQHTPLHIKHMNGLLRQAAAADPLEATRLLVEEHRSGARERREREHHVRARERERSGYALER